MVAAAWRLAQFVQRADRGGDYLRRDGGITGGGVDTAVAEQHLNDANIGAVLQQVSGERVAQGVDGDAFGDAGAGAASRQASCKEAVLKW